jgi:hypothetical protein
MENVGYEVIFCNGGNIAMVGIKVGYRDGLLRTASFIRSKGWIRIVRPHAYTWSVIWDIKFFTIARLVAVARSTDVLLLSFGII